MVVATATRRRADGGPSARSLLISVLGQWVGPNDTPVWTATLVGALEVLGIESRAARQAVNRTAADGWLEGESVGRYTRWRLTSSGRRMIGSAVPRVQRSIVADQKWDGTFLLLMLTGTALDREARERLAVGLDFEGFGTLGTGTWVAVGEGSREGAEVVLTACGLQDEALLFQATTVEGAETPAEVVAMAWDLATAAAAHEAATSGDAHRQQPGDAQRRHCPVAEAAWLDAQKRRCTLSAAKDEDEKEAQPHGRQ